MKETLFRGKSIDSDQWEFGQLVKGRYYLDLKPVAALMSVDLLFYPRCEVSGWADVDPATIGQFIGLVDKNGRKIFEGDIVKHYNSDLDPAAFSVGKIFWNSGKCRWSRTATDRDYFPEVWSSSSKYYEVIGNIHDNPELLEVYR